VSGGQAKPPHFNTPSLHYSTRIIDGSCTTHHSPLTRYFSIKGPGYRIANDVRRVWTCPKCGRTRRLPGNVVSQRCDCESPGVWMHLTAEPERRGFVVPMLVEPAELPKADEPPEARTEPAAAMPAAIPVPVVAPAWEPATPTLPPQPPEVAPVPKAETAAPAPPTAPDAKPAAAAEAKDAGQPPRKSRRKRNRGRRRKRKSGES